MSDLAAQFPKDDLRRDALAKRDALSVAMRQQASDVIAARRFPLDVKAGNIVSGFLPIKSEINPLPLLRKYSEAGAQLALPVVIGRGQRLVFRAWNFADNLVKGQWGLREPSPQAQEVFPDILLVPLAAFDRSGHRIGYGAGYYDMTIAHLRAMKPIIAVGIAFAAQEIAQVPATIHDARLDLVLTERETIDFRSV